MERTVVVGGGVIGLTTAVVLAERGARVSVWSREPARLTTSAVAGGLAWPYRIEPEDRAVDWSVRSYHVFAGLTGEPETTGVRMVRGTMADGWAPAEWTRLVGTPPCPPLIDMNVYLRYLHTRLEAAGGRCEERGVTSLDEAAAGAAAVVNCAGLAARELVPDPLVRPVRGQVVVVENPGIDEWYAATEGAASTYILPQPYGVLLGGTAEDGDENTAYEPATAEAIVERCARVRPELAGARVLEHRVGLRPFRPSVRIEAERLGDGTPVVHHYGHGGAGVTVSWGCAEDAADLVTGAS